MRPWTADDRGWLEKQKQERQCNQWAEKRVGSHQTVRLGEVEIGAFYGHLAWFKENSPRL